MTRSSILPSQEMINKAIENAFRPVVRSMMNRSANLNARKLSELGVDEESGERVFDWHEYDTQRTDILELREPTKWRPIDAWQKWSDPGDIYEQCYHFGDTGIGLRLIYMGGMIIPVPYSLPSLIQEIFLQHHPDTPQNLRLEEINVVKEEICTKPEGFGSFS